MIKINKNFNKIFLSVVAFNLFISFVATLSPIFQSFNSLIHMNIRAIFGQVPFSNLSIQAIDEFTVLNTNMLRFISENYALYATIAFTAFYIANIFVFVHLIYLIFSEVREYINLKQINRNYNKSPFVLSQSLVFCQPNCKITA